VSVAVGLLRRAKVDRVYPSVEGKAKERRGLETGSLSPSQVSNGVFCFRVSLNNLQQQKKNKIPAACTVMIHWHSIQEKLCYATGVEILTDCVSHHACPYLLPRVNHEWHQMG
jgi:hypothetical protein